MKYKYPKKTFSSFRKSETLSLKEALQEALKSFRSNPRYLQAQVSHSWERVMGPTVKKRTSRLFIKNQVLYVEISSAPLKNELRFSKDKILEAICQDAGNGTLNDIVFI